MKIVVTIMQIIRHKLLLLLPLCILVSIFNHSGKVVAVDRKSEKQYHKIKVIVKAVAISTALTTVLLVAAFYYGYRLNQNNGIIYNSTHYELANTGQRDGSPWSYLFGAALNIGMAFRYLNISPHRILKLLNICTFGSVPNSLLCYGVWRSWYCTEPLIQPLNIPVRYRSAFSIIMDIHNEKYPIPANWLQ